MESEILGNLSVYAIISTVAGFILSFFNKEMTKYENNKEKYYENVLLPFYNEVTKNKQLNIKEFYNNKVLKDEIMEFVPNYIHYLGNEINTDKSKILKEVLILDYLEHKPSLKSSLDITIGRILDRSSFVILFSVSIILVFLVVFFIITIILSVFLILLQEGENVFNFVDFSIIGMLILIIYLYLKRFNKLFYYNDLYTYDKRVIERTIKRKIEQYEKIKTNIYFLK